MPGSRESARIDEIQNLFVRMGWFPKFRMKGSYPYEKGAAIYKVMLDENGEEHLSLPMVFKKNYLLLEAVTDPNFTGPEEFFNGIWKKKQEARGLTTGLGLSFEEDQEIRELNEQMKAENLIKRAQDYIEALLNLNQVFGVNSCLPLNSQQQVYIEKRRLYR